MGSQFDSQIPGLELEKQWFKKLECFSVEVLLLSLSFECPEEFCLNNWLKKNNKSACCYHLGIWKVPLKLENSRDYLPAIVQILI